ncbi:T-cell receptor alpha chain V region CTL-F3 [Anabarilius grahami]|nr:T-cell receptor alpha chain V region CTL-F3 [Anabarilius grahami]
MAAFCLFFLMTVSHALFADKSVGQTITPLQITKNATERETVILSCKYDDSQARSLHWYRQYLGSRPEFLLLVYESGSVTPADPPFPRLNGSVNKVEKQVDLQISSAAVTDSALYYCALEPTVTGRANTLYKNLRGVMLK